MNALGKFIKDRFKIDVECIGRYSVILEEHKELSVSQLVVLRGALEASEIVVAAYDNAQVPGDQHPQLLVRIIR